MNRLPCPGSTHGASPAIPVATPAPSHNRDNHYHACDKGRCVPPDMPPSGAEEAGRHGANNDSEVTELIDTGTCGPRALIYVGGQHIPFTLGLIIDCQLQLVRVAISSRQVCIGVSDADIDRL